MRLSSRLIMLVIFISPLLYFYSARAVSLTPQAKNISSYKSVREIPLAAEGSWEEVAIEPVSRKLYLALANRVLIVNLSNRKVSGEIKNTPGAFGFALAPELNWGFSSNAQENKVSVIDLATLETVEKVPTGKKPEALVYDPGQQEVYAFNGDDHSVTAVQALSSKVIALIQLSGKPEFGAVDAAEHKVYVNLEDKNKVAVIDTLTHKVVAEWSTLPGQKPSTMAIDLKDHRLLIGCANEKLVMMDSKDGKIVGQTAMGAGADSMAYDAETNLVFVANTDGTVTVSRVSADKLEAVQTLKTEPGARRLALDSKTHEIFVPTAQYKADGKTIVPGSLKLMVYGPQN